MLLGVVVVAIVVLAVALASSGSQRAPSLVSPTSRPGLETIFEADPQLHANPVGALDLLRRLGVDRVKLFVAWSTVAPNPSSRTAPLGFDASTPAAYPSANWTYYDTVIRDATERGIGLYVAVGGPAPKWATGPGAPPGGPPGVWKPSASEFGAFMRAVASRYTGHYTPSGSSSPLPRVSVWSIWNEPNLGSDLAPQAIDRSTVERSPALYRGLVDAGWRALQETGHGSDTILIGELAPYGQPFGYPYPGNFGYMQPLRFVRALYCVNASLQPLRGTAAASRGCPTTAAASKRFVSDHPGLFRAGGFAVHPYPQGSVPPDVVLPDGPDFVNLASAPKLEQLLDEVTSTYGASKRFPLYTTEYGYFTNPPYQDGARPGLAAAYLNWAEYIAWRNPRMRSWDQYLLTDPPQSSGSNFDSGLEFANGTPKPSFYAFRMPLYMPVTRANRGASLEVWGCVRPAHYAELDTGRSQRAQIELRSAAGGGYRAITTVPITNRDGYFDVDVEFPSSGSVRLAWSYPHGPTIYSRLVAVTIH